MSDRGLLLLPRPPKNAVARPTPFGPVNRTLLLFARARKIVESIVRPRDYFVFFFFNFYFWNPGRFAIAR